MDPAMYIASSQLDRPERCRTDAIEAFYHTHGHLPVWTRSAGVVAVVYGRLRVLLQAQSAKVPGGGAASTRMVR